MSIKPPGFLPLLPFVPNQGAGGASLPRAMFRSLAISASGLSAQRLRLEVSATNVANAETTRTAEGGPYRRRTVQLEANQGAQTPVPALPTFAGSPMAGGEAGGMVVTRAGTVAIELPSIPAMDPDDAGGVRVAGIVQDQTEGPLVYDPGHPDADQNGYVRMPNVNITDEMVELMTARRLYDANATVFQSAKSMLRRAIDI